MIDMGPTLFAKGQFVLVGRVSDQILAVWVKCKGGHRGLKVTRRQLNHIRQQVIPDVLECAEPCWL